MEISPRFRMEDFDDMSGLEKILADPKTREELGKAGPLVEFRARGGQLLATGRIVGQEQEAPLHIFWPENPDVLDQTVTYEGTMLTGTKDFRVRMSFYKRRGLSDWVYQLV